jgi:hypothetical protein
MRILVAVLAAALTGAVAQDFRVTGVVVESETGTPLGRTRVVLANPAGEVSTLTKEDGRFSFEVPQGKYTLRASHRDWGASYGQPSPSSDSGYAIVVGPDRDTTNVIFRFRMPCVVRGRVVDEDGEPLSGATVELFFEPVVDGRKGRVSLGRAGSDDFGNYSWSSLFSGTYYLVASGAPWYMTDERTRDGLERSGNMPVPYAPVWLPGVGDAAEATPLVLRPGAEVHADFQLRPAAGGTLRIMCPGAPCSGNASLYAVGARGEVALIRPDADQEGVDKEGPVMQAVPPGRYLVQYSGSEGKARKLIDVTGVDVTVEIVPKPPPTLEGRVIFERADDKPHSAVYVNMRDETTGEVLSTALAPEGRFSWPSVATSRVRLFLTGEDGFFVSRMSVEGAGFRNGVIEIVDGEAVKVNVVASRDTGGLTGLLTQDDKPVAGTLVVLAPGTAPDDTQRYRGVLTDSDGSFEFTNVPTGDYVLFAIDDTQFPYADPTSVAPYLATGNRVRIESHASSSETIHLTRQAH